MLEAVNTDLVFHHQPEAQHAKSSAIHKPQADYPILERLRGVVRKAAKNSGGNLDVAMRRVLMWASADPSLVEKGIPEYILDQVAHYVLPRNLDLSEEEVLDKTLAFLEKGPEAFKRVFSINERSRQEQLDAALFDVAVDLHPDWEAAGPKGDRVRYIGKRRPGKRGERSEARDSRTLTNLVVWLFKKHPSKAQAIEQYFEVARGRLADIDLYRPDHDAFAATLTSLDDRFSKKWKKSAALPGDRIKALRAFHERGIFTWVSLEPTLDVEASLAIVESLGNLSALRVFIDYTDCLDQRY